MRGIACALLLLAACGDDGTPTQAASLMNATPAVQSAYSKSFTAQDGSMTKVLAWKIDLISSSPGTGCQADGVKVVGTVTIFTSQPASNGGVGMLTTGDTSIVLDNPPTAPMDGQVAVMGILGVANVEGTVSITGVDKTADEKTVTGLEGTVVVAGLDNNGNTVNLSGMFKAPVCSD